MKNFADRVMDAIDGKRNPSCVGLDPRFEMIPGFIRDGCCSRYGKTNEAVAQSFLEFNRGIIDAIRDHVAIVKPQSAYYEAYGGPGVSALEKTIEYAKKNGLLVIVDAKRGDVGHVAEMYSRAFLGEVESWNGPVPSFDVDAVTVNPFLGSDSVVPFISDCRAHGKGIFVLVKTSNPSSVDIQDARTEADSDDVPIGKAPSHADLLVPIYSRVAAKVRHWGDELLGERGYSSIGAVVGATFPDEAKVIREMMPQSFFLVPGYGAQGGSSDDVVGCFNKDGYGAIVNSSRGIIYSGTSPDGDRESREEEFTTYARDAAAVMQKAILSSMKAAGKCPW